MNPDAPLELRIHSGLHAGAHAPLGGQSQRIGPGPQDDFVLADAGFQEAPARLWCRGDACSLEYPATPGDDAEPRGRAFARGELVCEAGVVLSVNHPDDAWPEPGAVQAVLAATETASTPASPPSSAEATAIAEPQPAPQPPAPTLPSRRVRPLGLVALLGTVALALAGLVALLLHTPGGSAPVRATASPAPSLDAQRAAIERIAGDMDIGTRVELDTLPGGTLRVRAALLDDDELERLAQALSRLSPRPALAVVSEPDLLAQLQDAIAQLGEPGLRLSAASLGQGRFAVRGDVRDAAQRERVLQRLRQALPPIVTLAPELMAPQDRGERLLAALKAGGVADVQGHWADGQMHMKAVLAQADVPAWERLLARASHEHPAAFTALLQVRPATINPTARQALARLPFGMRTVVSGPSPYVVLDNGTKLMVGATEQGWRLVSLDDSRVVFADPKARPLTIAR